MQVTHNSAVLRFVTVSVFGLLLLGCEPNNESITVSQPEDPTLCSFKTDVCAKTVADVEIQLSLNPWQAPSEKPLTMFVTTSKSVTDLKVKLQGRDMFMGVIPVNLAQTDKTHYQGEFVYGSCSSGYMVWSAIVSFTIDDKELFTTFDFLADNPG
ncbi:hypothetical protein [Shewanella fidelis]|uniref:Lipoprotein n=1 Tax=Shewanella fidelis TaxID=173509 RepID=A0AAW8NKT1_9GAMM|nr:hypothetical protein [Shewanella fidelis]MDR8523862.1 hypothetical protein [Shewanella fidelis]MDW4810409.1 hypothetical protein [Shewanella fidelis]MDW4814530.1 hypothetical protein [Shewanella fidelis]MDW4818620.1 hypothetical protein [Shewanella fidelis]MDW4823703.1 hypothetical protein [Shewanella fidelis]